MTTLRTIRPVPPAPTAGRRPAPPPMTPERVVATASQFGQRVSAREARAISSLLRGWRA